MLRIADFSRVLAGPYATMLLADFGAEVVKVERPVLGDDTRHWGPPFAADGQASYFVGVNRNKRSVAIDLSTDAGVAAARDLISQSDVVVENFAPGTMRKFGLDYPTLAATQPRLIYCSITGFGDSELAAAMPGYDLLVQALGGLMSITGPDPQHPTKVGVALVDVITGLHAVIGIQQALLVRAETGMGQQVEVNLLSSALSALVNQSAAFAAANVIPEAIGNAHPSIVPYQLFETSEQQLVLAVGNDSQFRAACHVLGVDELAADERFATNPARVRNRDELIPLLQELLTKQPAAVWEAEFTAHRVPAGRVNNIEQAVELATRLGLEPIVEIAGVRTIANPIKLSKTPASYRTAPPRLPEVQHD